MGLLYTGPTVVLTGDSNLRLGRLKLASVIEQLSLRLSRYRETSLEAYPRLLFPPVL